MQIKCHHGNIDAYGVILPLNIWRILIIIYIELSTIFNTGDGMDEKPSASGFKGVSILNNPIPKGGVSRNKKGKFF